ncbi:polysaccharide biosynthesis tyrosine autokinase [Waterburya agarophytonicola K14]|uniref:non-specific protein-tyrosine kinase n=1 Tax=Waterburya agarophytonicola KI4 TaxID=2874699 RepID=A0A964BTS1_9CYAN|nr:polysaccharide biosynthesis tyrosine autokinase [Waterburya agarophytonicola]MCC0178373.1 polysaccharide biosynthesis tyrosine autokinase [Waterburya agarophytonicola KI4]
MPDRSSDRSAYPPVINGNGNRIGDKNGNDGYLYSPPVVNQVVSSEVDGDGLDLRQLASIVKHRLRLIGAVAFGVTTAVALITYNQEPLYQGKFQLLVEPLAEEQEDPLSLLQQDFGGLDYDSQIEVLQSPHVLDPIVENLQSKYPELEYKELIKPKKQPLRIKQVDQTKILEVSYVDEDPQKIQYVLDNLSEAYLRYSLEERRVEVKQGLDFVESQLPEVRNRVDDLQGRVQKFRQQYNLLNPEKQAEILANKQVDFEQNYFATQSELKETRSLYALLQKQLGLQPQQALAASYLSESPRYQNLLNELQKVEVELAQESARFLPSNPIVQNLEEKKNKLLILLQQEAGGILGDNLANSVENTPNLTSPSSLRLELNQQYIQAANKIEILEIRQQALGEAMSQLEDLTKQMPIIARQYTDLKRELTVATESLTRFLTAQEELQLKGAQQALPWQTIAQPIVTERPISPNPPRNLALGLVSGVLLGLGAALLAERLDPVFHSSEELKESINLPILGLIPVQKDLKPLDELETSPKKEKLNLPQLQIGNTTLNLNNSPKPESTSTTINSKQKWYGASPFLEAFRSLNTNIKLLGSDTSIRSFVISSSIPSEGKSTISCHLAQAAAAMGQKVLLIDADLRRPQVHRWIGVENEEGLSNVLATGLDIEEAIVKVPQWENLSVVTAGDIPPDPTRLLASQKMHTLMERLKSSRKYDLIIYDTPPILGFADGRILSTRTNGVVLVVRIGKTDRSLLKQNIDNIRMSNVPVLGVIANQVNRSSNSYHYYSHYYSEAERK